MAAQRPTLEVLASLVDQLTGPLRATAEKVKEIADTMNTALEAVGVGLSVAALGEFFKTSIEKSAEAEQALDFLRQAVNNAGGSFAAWQPKIDAAVDSVHNMSTATKADLTDALTKLIAKSGDTQGSINNLGMVADIAAFKHETLGEAADQVGKAMTGNNRTFMEFGITAGTTAEKMEQLHANTAGYAEIALGTLSGQVQLAKRGLTEFEESVGDVITGSGTAKDTVGFFATALGNLKLWVDDNKASLETFIGQVVSTVKAVGSALSPIWDLITALGKGVEATIGWRNLWDGFRVSLVAVGAAFGEIAAGAEYMVGALLEKFGTLVATSAPLFKVLGINVGTWSANVIQSGKDMESSATASFKSIADKSAASMQAIMDHTDAAESHITTTHADNASTRIAAITKEQEAAIKRWDTELQAADTAIAAITAEFTKDFAGTMGTAAAETQNKIAKITAEIDKLTEESKGSSGVQLEQFQAQIKKAEDTRVMYEAVLPVFGQIAALSLQVTQTESDTEPHLRLQALNADLTTALGLRASTLGNTAAQKALDSEIATIQKDIATATKQTQIAAADMSGPNRDQADSDRQRAEKTAAIEAHEQNVRDALKEGVNGAISLATQFGAIDQQTASVLTNAIGIGQALASGNPAGAVAGMVGLLGSLFGASPENAARKALLDKNNQRLSDLAAINGKLVDQSDSGAKIQRVLNALEKTGMSVTGPGQLGINSGDFAANLMAGGGTFQDAVDLAKSLGIDLGSTNSQTSAALPQLMNALKNFKPQAFGSDYQGQLSQSSFTEGLSGGQLSASDYYKALSGSAGSSFLSSQIFKGISDPTKMSAADWATLAANVQSVGGNINSFTPEQLGGLSLGDLTSTLTGLGGLSPSTSTSVAPVTSSTITAPIVTTSTGSGLALPTGTSITVTDDQGWGFKSLADFLGPKLDRVGDGIDTTNSKLDTIEQTMYDGFGAVASAISGGALANTIGRQIQTQADLASVTTGG